VYSKMGYTTLPARGISPHIWVLHAYDRGENIPKTVDNWLKTVEKWIELLKTRSKYARASKSVPPYLGRELLFTEYLQKRVLALKNLAKYPQQGWEKNTIGKPCISGAPTSVNIDVGPASDKFRFLHISPGSTKITI
jgi:hypothetical protein